MIIAFGADHAGFSLKEELKEYISSTLGYEYIDFGTYSAEEKVNYPDYAIKVAKAIKENKCEFGILICATGIGMSMAANRMEKIRAALCYNTQTARLARLHNDSNILVLGAKMIKPALAKEMTRIFLSTPGASEARHIQRIKKIDEIAR
jgi:RpiB/LacA/LacB family sugar-phosphate isomerase